MTSFFKVGRTKKERVLRRGWVQCCSCQFVKPMLSTGEEGGACFETPPLPLRKRQLWRESITYYSSIESTVACRTGIISVSFKWKERKARLAWSVSRMQGEEHEKITPVHIPLFKQFQCSNMNTATQLVTLHHMINRVLKPLRHASMATKFSVLNKRMWNKMAMRTIASLLSFLRKWQ